MRPASAGVVRLALAAAAAASDNATAESCFIGCSFHLTVLLGREIAGEGSIIVDSSGARPGDEAADVTLSADAETFQSMLEGDTDPTSAFMTGKLSVEGDMALAMQLAAALA